MTEINLFLKDFDVSVSRLPQSGFEFVDWPVTMPFDGVSSAELLMVHWELIPHYIRNPEELEHWIEPSLRKAICTTVKV